MPKPKKKKKKSSTKAVSLPARIDRYEPRGSWRGIQSLVKAILAVKASDKRLAHLFRLFERFPEADGGGAFLSLRHDIEKIPGYEKALVESLKRTPSEAAKGIAVALINAGTSRVQRVDLKKLIAARPANAKTNKSQTKSSGVRGEDLLPLLGKIHSSRDVATALKAIGVTTAKVSGRDSDGGFLGCTKTGFSLHFDEDGVLDALFIPPGFKDNERTTVELPFDLTLTSSRAAVRKILGKPKKTGNYKGNGMFDFAFDTFVTNGLWLMVKYAPDVSRIEAVEISSV